jgi:transcriptional regulator with XRE-family HTH domain
MAVRRRGIIKSIHTEAHKAFCALLIEARNAANLTQQDVAKKLRTTQSFVAKYEGGERRLDVVEFINIARVIGADPVRLLRALIRAMP